MIKLISTGILGLDDLLGGGITPGTIIDIFGPGGSGKTQLAMQISLNSLQDGTVLYLDATGEFSRSERMLQLIKSKNLDPSLLDHVIVGRMMNIGDPPKYIEKISELRPNLVVIENITDLFSFEYYKEANLLEKHLRFMEYMHDLSLTAINTKIPVIVTNMVRSMDGMETENLNKSISMFTHKKIKLEKLENDEKDDKVFKAQVLPSFGKRKEILYTITEAGLVELP
ncbi:MAG TPA: ATPase domain-containing protein [Candidatus Nitrosotalea sp.]|nr:ATPase domain-containing protein [Candidatus Nitrosotalea sp.]